MKDKLFDFLMICACVLVFALILGFVAIEIWAIVKYGNKPITEVPSWVLWLLWRNNK